MLALQNIQVTGGYFTSNGSKVYPDCDGVEYATPECRGPYQATAADHSGIDIVWQMADDYMREKGWEYGQHDNKGTTYLPPMRITGSYDPKGEKFVTRGYHENFLLPAIQDPEKVDVFKKVMSAYYATRSIWNGTGLVADGFRISQKDRGIGNLVKEMVSGQRVMAGQKPMAALQTQSTLHSSDKISDGWWLLETRYAESHMMRTATFMSLAVTSAVMRLVEYDYINKHNYRAYTLEKPLSAMSMISAQMGHELVELEDGTTITGADHQMRLLEAVDDLKDMVRLPTDEVTASGYVHETCNIHNNLDKKEPDYKKLARRAEWAAKYCLLQKRYGDTMFTTNHKDAIMSDRAWHSPSYKKDGSHDAARLRGLDPMFDSFEALINTRHSSAPEDTRAHVRAAAIRDGKCRQANWNALRPTGFKQDTLLSNPYDPTTEIEAAPAPSSKALCVYV